MGSQADTRHDQALWDAVVGGDTDAFGELFLRHRDAVHTLCFRRVASWSAAEDLTSVVFMEVWRTRRPLVLDSGTLRPWLTGVAIKVTGRHRRTMARHEALLRQIPADPQRAELADTVAAKIDDEKRMATVLSAIRRLPRREQDVIAACVFAGLDYAAAATALSIPVGTVRSRLSRARRRLSALTASVTVTPSSNPRTERS